MSGKTQNKETKKRAFSLDAILAKEVFETSVVPISVQDFEGKIVAANVAMAECLGYELDEVVGEHIGKFIHPQWHGWARKIRHILLSGESLKQPYEQRGLRKDGTQVVYMMATSVLEEDGAPIAFFHIGRDITYEMQLQDELRLYIQQITKAHEEERSRIARELHDETVQALIIISQRMDTLMSTYHAIPDEVLRFLEKLRRDVDSVLAGTRRLTQDLRPPALEYLGLVPALRELISQSRTRTNCNTKLRVKGSRQRLTDEEELLTFRIIQEALQNVWKHSRATEANVGIEFGDAKTRVVVTDNGEGFKPLDGPSLVKKGKLGLVGMRERARLLGATLTIEPGLDSGTTIILDIPHKHSL